MNEITSQKSTPFSEFMLLCKALEETASRNEKEELIADFLNRIKTEEVAPSVLLLSTKIIPEKENESLGIGYRTLRKATEATEFQPLISFSRDVTISEVSDTLQKIASTSGEGSSRQRRSLLASLYHRMSDEEQNYLTRALMGELRVGVVEGVLLAAVAQASDSPLKSVRRAYMLSGGLGEIAELAMEHGQTELESVSVTLFSPLRPMLASPSDSIEEALEMTGVPVAVEVKYDGARVQIHKDESSVRIFSRRLSDVTVSLPDVVAEIRRAVFEGQMVLEGEVVGVDDEGRPLPFQDLMRRFGRINALAQAARRIPLELYIFDILFLDGRLLVDMSYRKRYSVLRDVAPEGLLAERLVISDLQEARALYEEAVKEGHEGVMLKSLDAPYILGTRGKHWVKVKQVDTLDLVIVGSDWGHGRRTGWLSDYYLAAHNTETNSFDIVGKTFKGLTDAEIQQMTQKLLDLRQSQDKHTVWVEPRIVVEVAFNEIQKSPRYASGYALRLARIRRIRNDKSPVEAGSITEVADKYEGQFRSKGRLEE